MDLMLICYFINLALIYCQIIKNDLNKKHTTQKIAFFKSMYVITNKRK